ncbi:hypothetical protein ABQE69_13725 [Mycolicibacillus trivialis]|nr:hypothetical protein [Mycolicibacillus trivialis]
MAQDRVMGLVGFRRTVLSDAEVAEALSRAVRLIDPMVVVLADADLFGLKARTYQPGGGDAPVDRVLDGLAVALNIAHAPGTRAWATMDVRHRVNWWVRRVGAANTVLVASPRAFGVLSAALPVQDMLGFANQAIVLCAVAREYGVTDRGELIRLLAAVLCNRELDADVIAEAQHHGPEPHRIGANPFAFARSLWHLAGVLRRIRDELDQRPQPRGIFRRLGVLPGVGGLAGYLGEYGALRRAAKAAIAHLRHDTRPDADVIPIRSTAPATRA